MGCVLIGEILIDRIMENGTEIVGGSTFNINRNLHRLNQKSTLFSSVGSDSYGNFILKKLNDLKIDKSNINVTDTSTSRVDIYNDGETPIPNFFRGSDYQILFDEHMENVIKNSSILHFSFWPLSMEPSKQTIMNAIKIAKENNVIIGFDPNYHEDLITSESLTKDELMEILKVVDIVKPSLDDTIRIFGKRSTNEDYIKIYEDLGCQLIILSLGSKGIIASYKGERIKLQTLATEIVEVTGAGDAFWSGLYSGLLTGNTIYNSIELGLASSAEVLKVIGGDVKFPSIKELKEKYDIRVKI